MTIEAKPNEEAKPTVPVQTQEVPRTKEDWKKLSVENPTRWMELTQERMDQTTREARETKEKLTEAEKREKNLLAEVERLKQQPPQPADNATDGEVIYGNGRYPQSEEEWNNLFLERPTFANDLRNEYLGGIKKVQTEYVEEKTKAVKTLTEEHPDMYIVQLDDLGKPKKDEHGKFIHAIDPNTNGPIFNPDSEKGKLWVEIWNEEDRTSKNQGRPNVFSVTGKGPLLMMAEMERRLRQKGAKMVNQQAQNNSGDNDLSGLAPQGVPAPKTDSLKFSSDEERALAQKRVNAGVYKSLEEYVKWRDGGPVNFDHSNSRPDFSKK